MKDELWRMGESRGVICLRTAGMSSTFGDCPFVGVGNAEYNGDNPSVALSIMDKISFYLESYGRAKFGEKRSVLINKK